MKLHPMILGLAIHCVSLVPSAAAPAEAKSVLGEFGSYEQGKPVSLLIETRQAVFQGTADEAVRSGRERALLAFIASDAGPQAKAIAIEWLGILGSAASVPGLMAVRENPALAAPVAAALERIPGPEARRAAISTPENRLAVSPAAAGVAAFASALDKQPAGPVADELIVGALRSPNDLLAGAALRRIRAGAGSPSLTEKLLAGIEALPAGRRAMLWEALATRPEAAEALHPVLTKLARAADPDSRAGIVSALGRILRPDDLPMVLGLAADTATPGLSAAANAALVRATNPGINPALIRIAGAAGPQSIAAIDALAARHAVEATDQLRALALTDKPGISAAAYKALGVVIVPDQAGDLLKKLAASDGTPVAGPLGKLTWDVIRRHPDPAAAAAMLEQAAATAPPETKKLLVQYAARIRPKNDPGTQISLDLPTQDDRGKLIPDGHEEVVYLNCGSFTEALGGKVAIRRTAGANYQFGGIAHPLATVDFGKEVTYEITGLDPGADYVLGFSAWDADQKARRQSLQVNGREFLTDFAPLAWHADKPAYTRIHLPLPRDATSGGKATVTMKSVSGPNAVISELWLSRRKPGAAVKRVLILTGDDYPAHLWRETGPEFAEILRADPRLEVTISESPALLGSPVLSSYDAVFLHFKNYAERLPTSEPLWKNLEQYVRNGGGLVIAHFGCGAMQEWNGFVNVAGRVWDPKKRGHDPYGQFLVRILEAGHPATKGLKDFTTTDELYTCLAGDVKIDVLAEATSVIDKSAQPMAFVLQPGKGRVFNSPLGHNLGALEAAGARALYLRGTLWAAGL